MSTTSTFRRFRSACGSSLASLLLGIATYQAKLWPVARLPASFHSHGGHGSSPAASSSSSYSSIGRAGVKVTTGTTEVEVEKEEDGPDQLLLQQGIVEYFDESSDLWENIWGEHMHQGFYEPNSLPDRFAQIRMIEESLRFASLPTSEDATNKPTSIVDVGCGIGASSRYLARKYGAKCQGINLGPAQVQRAQALAVAQGLADKVSFHVADALNQPFPDGQFDLVLSMESAEHMPDKLKFVSELVRVAAPGGTIIIVTWCHRDLSPTEESLRPEEKELLDKISDAICLPAWCSAADYVNLLQSLSLQDIKSADWSKNVAPCWPAAIRAVLTWKGFTLLLRSGWKTKKEALVMLLIFIPLMIEAAKKGVVKYSIITCRKPA